MARGRVGRQAKKSLASKPSSAKTTASSSKESPVKLPPKQRIDIKKGLNLDEWSRQHWNYFFDSSVVDKIYNELVLKSFNVKEVNKYEFSQYLERYLWPNLDVKKANKAHILSIVVLINAKFRERVNPWNCVVQSPESFPAFFRKVLEYSLQNSLPFLEQNVLITFISHCVNSLEIDCVRAETVKLASLACWQCLGEKYREKLLGASTKFRKYWNKMNKAFDTMPAEKRAENEFYANVIWKLIRHFKLIITELDDENITFDPDAAMYCEKFVLLLIDLECQLTTRRFLHALIVYSHCIIHAITSQFYLSEPGTLFFKLMRLLLFYVKFEVENWNGYPLSLAEIQRNHYDFVNRLQVIAFSKEELFKMAYEMDLIGKLEEGDDERLKDSEYLKEILIFHTTRPISQLDKINAQPLYPNEQVIWDENLVPYDEYNGEGVLPLNRLNLQFLTLHDYLLRNFNLFQMESTYEIRSDLEDVLFRMRPYKHEMLDNVVWGGWARMALPITTTRIVHVGKPFVGYDCPSEVKADVTVNLPKRTDLRREWEGLRQNDVLFLVTVVPIFPVGSRFDVRRPFKEQFRIEAVRGCEVEGILNNEKEVIDEQNMNMLRALHGDARTFRVRLDPNQYKADTERTDIYFKFNLMIRRDAKSNNFKAVLATIRQLLNTECVVPDWIHDVLLGYGEPDAAHYKKLPNAVTSLNFNDTFLDIEHLKKSFEGEELKIAEYVTVPPFKLTFNELNPQHDKEVQDKSIVVEAEALDAVQRELKIETRKNAVPFTAAQIEAIKSGMEPGLTMVVGPPGTGKTDVAVQIISNIYHNWPEERTLIVTHSNQALNQLFEKIMALDIDERHLLRLGHGEEELETTKDFSRNGRVNYVLNERVKLLKQVARLRLSLNEQGEVESSCENAGYFFRYTVTRTWENFLEEIEAVKEKEKDFVKNKFPFTKYFVEGEQELFKAESFDEDLEKANACWEFIRRIFMKLDEFRAFELLRNGKERADYLLTREAKIIAMTCTHAALKRKDLVELGFHYDNILMEESAQILEVETFIPLLLQESNDGINRLKRWIMIGDHHQLPPVVQNPAYQKYSNMEQSLFARFIRLGVPSVQLDAQGRARPEIAELYNWRYKTLGNLPHVLNHDMFIKCNPGFQFTYQFIDVPDFNGAGETTPSAYFYQNLGEAEYAAQLYIYMRILGYPADKITILTTYNGQRSLLYDIFDRRCKENPLLGMPHIISTVDKYQGQQNDYVILSLVRTRNIGHLRDIRRLVVAMSRARLGLYILGRKTLFNRCLELQPVFRKLEERPTNLCLFPSESFDETTRKADEKPGLRITQIKDTVHMANFVTEFYKANLELLQSKYEATMAKDETVEVMEVEEEKKEEEKAPEVPIPLQSTKKDKESTEGNIMFEEIDFERLEKPPTYG
ncbi:unnamed protein product [Bursaphelenchus okinawaensis]|uniref:Intron-binding protein aquarius n=1 Tax=Bursaphelenchus okinawaensis TaxID=465554 RepID=A0A811L9H4_9BILA|nr:unnamed protein product [Bursaphelenchus okinawaensis]CAG9118753.1 unnamed protein product [Bursaphelenchus okinawaensis]